jgi:hypothetical protein
MFAAIQQFLGRFRARRAGGIRYKIGGKLYLQRTLVLLQVEQLAAMLAQFDFPQGAGAIGIVNMLGDRLANVLAIVLTPEGVEVDEKDLDETVKHLRRHVDISLALQVVEDFLSCNPVASVFDRLTGLAEKAMRLTQAGLPNSSVSSQQET